MLFRSWDADVSDAPAEGPGAGGGDLRGASPAEGASEAEAVQIVPDTTEEFPAVVEKASPPRASEPAEGPSDGREEPAAAPWDAAAKLSITARYILSLEEK